MPRDPLLVDRFAQDGEVILLDNCGVGASIGVVPLYEERRRARVRGHA
jgi:hypothetical protein